MDQTQRFPNVDVAGGPRAMLPMLIAGMVLLVAVPPVVMVLRPALVQSLMAFMGSAASADHNPSWILPALAVGVVVGAAVLALVVLAAFARGVAHAPFLWLAPVLVGFSTTVLVSTRVTLPLPGLSAALFAPAAGLLLIGGGALIQLRGWPLKVAGSLVVALPLLALLAAYTQAAGNAAGVWDSLDTSARLFLFVLTLTCCGVALVASVAHPAAVQSASTQLGQGWQQDREQLADALECLRLTELLLEAAEQRAQLAEHSVQARGFVHVDSADVATDDDDARDFAALARPGFSVLALAALGVLLGSSIAAAAYFGAYVPLQHRIAVQQRVVQTATKHHAAEIAALRQQHQAQQASLDATLATERAKATQALTALEQARAAAVASIAPVEPVEPVKLVKPSNAKKVSRTHAASRHRAVTKRVAARRKLRAAANPDQANQEPTFDRETRKALRDSASNDPIGGLEGI